MMIDRFNQAKAIVAKLARAGYIAYFAGGWVRDYVMGHPSEDIDIATNAPPVEIMNLFPHTILVGLAFGVVIVVMEGHQFEVASFRKDLPYLDGRHPQGIEMSTPREDALRRDFTINGMFYDPLEEVIHDFVHGQEDIHLGVIRTIGNPDERFFEDRLRMLRAFRFAARFSFTIDSDTQEAIRENADKLFPAVAMERVWQEFNKMVSYPRFDQAIVDMHRLTLLAVIFPELGGMHIKDLRQAVNAYAHYPPHCPTILYVMEFFHGFPLEQKIEITKRLKAANKDVKLLEFLEELGQALQQEESLHQIDLQQWVKLLAHPDCERALHVLTARYPSEKRNVILDALVQRLRALHPHIERLKAGKPLVSAALLQQQGIPPGKRMGALLKEAERLTIVEDWHDPVLVIDKLKTHPLWTVE
jgi:poly(A) polymerase